MHKNKTPRFGTGFRRIWPSLLCLLLPAPVLCQQGPLTIGQAVQRAVARYPSIRVSTEQVSSAAAAIKLARTTYHPRIDFLAQVNRATHNNVFGLLLPQNTLPVIANVSGPVLKTNSSSNVWGTAVGALVSWEPFDFGLRDAGVQLAKSAQDLAGAQLNVTKLQVAALTADAFLTILAAQQTVAAAQAGVERAKVLHDVVSAQVRNQLRPGADASRARAELAMAQTQVIQAEQAVEVGKAVLAQFLGQAPQSVRMEAGPLLQPPREPGMADTPPSQHPLAAAQTAAIEQVKARERLLERSYYPRFSLQGTSYARGTGVQPDGTTGNAASGLAPNTQNWAVGLTVTFPIFDFSSIRVRKEIERYNEQAEAARYEQVVQDLNGQQGQAKATLTGALKVAQNTPIQLDAARDTLQQATARYKAGLAQIVDVAEAQRLLTQAEIDDALAKLGIWRARLALSIAQGDLSPFLSAAAN
jgi:outer membrane protein TolC